MFSKEEFYSRVKKIKIMRSISGLASYSELKVIDNVLHFKRDNKNTYWQLSLDELYTAYINEQYFNTVILKKYISGIVYSPSLSLLLAINACDENGFRIKINLALIKKKVIDDIILRLTYDGSFQRANIYKKGIPDKNREEFRKYLAFLLSITLDKVLGKKKLTDAYYYKVIENFSTTITNKYSSILLDGTLRIGNAQKFLNLYWKLSWLLKAGVNKPIHCPFDSIVINKLDKSVRDIKWTKIKSISEYQRLVASAYILAAKEKSIAEWELKIYKELLNINKLHIGFH